MAFDRGGNFYVYDQANKSLLKFDPEGKSSGEAPLEAYFDGWIQRIRIDKSGRLFVLSKEQDDVVIERFDLAELFQR